MSNKANNFCLHLVSLLGKSTPVRGIGRRCGKRLKVSGQHSNFDFDRPVLSQEQFPPSGFPPGRFLPLIGSASAGSVLDSHNLETLSCMGGVSSRPGPRMTFGSKLPESRKGDAREGVKAMRLGSEGTKADPCRESCRFHQRTKAFPSCTAYKGSTAVQAYKQYSLKA